MSPRAPHLESIADTLESARAAEEAGRWDAALEIYDGALHHCAPRSAPAAELLRKIGLVHYYRGDFARLDDENWHCFTLSRYDRASGTWTLEKAPVYHVVD